MSTPLLVLGPVMSGALIFAVYHGAIWLRWRMRAPVIQLRCPSGSSWGAKFWNSPVWYDAVGTPYAKARDIGEIRLLPRGRTDDSLYRTEWTHLSGPAVNFTPAHNAHPVGNE